MAQFDMDDNVQDDDLPVMDDQMQSEIEGGGFSIVSGLNVEEDAEDIASNGEPYTDAYTDLFDNINTDVKRIPRPRSQ